MPAPVVFESRKFRVERRTFNANGTPHEHDVIAHPGAAVILPLLDDERVVLIRNYRVAVDGELLEVPAGTLDPDEAPTACAARELTEETGYRAGRIEPLLVFYSTPGILTERMHVFVARDLTPGAARPEPGEQITVTTLPLAEALAAVADGRIVDGKTIVALLYYARFRAGAGA